MYYHDVLEQERKKEKISSKTEARADALALAGLGERELKKIHQPIIKRV